MAHVSALPHPPIMDDDGFRDFPITSLVLGDSRALVLGRPAALRRTASRKAVSGSDAAPWKTALHRATRCASFWQSLVAALLALLAGLLLALTALQPPPRPSGGLPVHPAALTAPLVHVVLT